MNMITGRGREWRERDRENPTFYFFMKATLKYLFLELFQQRVLTGFSLG